MADPEFPIREGASTPDASTFEKIVCQNERIGTISGAQPGGSGNGQFCFYVCFAQFLMNMVSHLRLCICYEQGHW